MPLPGIGYPYLAPGQKPPFAPARFYNKYAVPVPDFCMPVLPCEVGGSPRDWRGGKKIALASGTKWSAGSLLFATSADMHSAPPPLTCGTSHTWICRFNWDGGGNSQGCYLFDQQTSRFIIAPRDSQVGSFTKIAYYDGTWRLSGPAVTQGWQTVAWVLDGNAGLGHIYRDGVETTTPQTYTPVALSGASVQALFDRYSDNVSGRMSGLIDYVQVFFSALSPAQVAAHCADPYMWFREPRRVFYSLPSTAGALLRRILTYSD